uniref:Transmembrane protein n=1 Tax=Panagrellus redivivus TaxID=6233 RepID=A0A7E4VUV6_PANRE
MLTPPMRVNLSPVLLYLGCFQMATVFSSPLTPSTVQGSSSMASVSADGSTLAEEHTSSNLTTELTPTLSRQPTTMSIEQIADFIVNEQYKKRISEVDAAVLAALNGPIQERLMTEAACLENCTSSLYRCVPMPNTRNYVCEMDAFMLCLVVVSALFTGICLPIACITFYVCGIYARLRRCLAPSKPFYSKTDNECFERVPETTCPSMQSTTALISTRHPPNYMERMYKKKHSTVHRYSQPQVELPRERAKSVCGGASVM